MKQILEALCLSELKSFRDLVEDWLWRNKADSLIPNMREQYAIMLTFHEEIHEEIVSRMGEIYV